VSCVTAKDDKRLLLIWYRPYVPVFARQVCTKFSPVDTVSSVSDGFSVADVAEIAVSHVKVT